MKKIALGLLLFVLALAWLVHDATGQPELNEIVPYPEGRR